MKHNRFTYFVGAVFALLAAPGVCYAGNETSAVQEAEKSAVSNDLVIGYNPGEFALGESDKERLSNLISDKPAIARVAVAGWSDLPFPKNSDPDLPRAERDLAEKRIERVVAHLRTSGKATGIETFNMAKKSTRLGQVFGTDDALLKKDFAGERSRDVEINHITGVLKDKGAPSTVVVIIYDQQALLSH